MATRSWSLADLAAAVAQILLFVPLALHRFVDGDEGVYAYASRLAVHGHLPYRDFFYEQTPLLLYVYGAWLRVAGESWNTVRIFSALLATAVGVLVYRHVRLRLGLPAAFAVLVLYMSSGLVLGYFTIVKTFALSTLFLVCAYVLAVGGRRYPAAGAMLGFAVDTRLLFAAAVPAFLLAAARAGRLRRLLAGLGSALAPAVVLIAVGPRAFYFDNVRYHSLKSSAGLVGDVHQKAQTAATLLGAEPTDRAAGIQFLVLLAACALALAATRGRGPAGLALAIVASLAVVSILPTPTYVQYFAVTVPFLAVAAGDLAARRLRGVWRASLAACLLVYAGAGVFAVRPLLRHDPLLRPSIGSVREVAARIEAETSPGEVVLSAWPGYLFGTHAQALSDYTNQFAPVAAARLSAASAHRYHVASEGELERRIRDRAVRLVVDRNWVTSPPFARWDAALAAARYRLVAQVQTARIYRRPGPGSTISP